MNDWVLVAECGNCFVVLWYRYCWVSSRLGLVVRPGSGLYASVGILRLPFFDGLACLS